MSRIVLCYIIRVKRMRRRKLKPRGEQWLGLMI